ncbi:helix-turn-helix domain-containing protein [Nocardioides zeae]|uniref:AcrR family transcriptional regulator n=1 Tax=Nocardioides zeae TaxID=1457234 RepID=A0AAJ1X2K9_9ACTN|nr:helix-turn-helix domain-containing protein [Nocardioides zeae]MDQ1106778.1 AcrR family transcriptional regulator [Nocardioides zeae]
MLNSVPDASLHRELLGATVRDLRRNRGLTLRDLARALAVSPATLSAIENGRTGTSSERVVQLADALGVRVERLVGNLAEPVSDERWALRASAGARAPGPAGDWRTYAPLVLDPALRGALATFLELGYHGATMRAVAARSGLSVAGLYHYYASKQQMLVTILDRTMSDLAARTDAAAAAGADPAERFANLVECLALFSHPPPRAGLHRRRRDAQPPARGSAPHRCRTARGTGQGGPRGGRGPGRRGLRRGGAPRGRARRGHDVHVAGAVVPPHRAGDARGGGGGIRRARARRRTVPSVGAAAAAAMRAGAGTSVER